MPRPSSEALTDREAQLMEILWSHNQTTAEAIRGLLPDDPHDSTVRTVLRILETKGYVARVGSGRPIVYKAIISREKAQRSALRRLLGRFFGGSPEALALRLLEDRHLTPEQLEALAHRSPASSGNPEQPASHDSKTPPSRRKKSGSSQEGNQA